jgi:hypothetical protein
MSIPAATICDTGEIESELTEEERRAVAAGGEAAAKALAAAARRYVNTLIHWLIRCITPMRRLLQTSEGL